MMTRTNTVARMIFGKPIFVGGLGARVKIESKEDE